MTWDASKPDASQSPGLAPTQIQTNWNRLQAMISGDHVFNATAPTPNTDGYHKVIHWITQITTPTEINGTGIEYAKDDSVTVNAVVQTAPHKFYKSYDGTTLITSPLSQVPIRAFVNFNGTTSGNNAVQTIRSSYNVTSVTRDGTTTGAYVITFASALPTNGFCVFATGMANSSGTRAVSYIPGSSTYSDSVSTTRVYISFRNIDTSGSNGQRTNVIMGNVVILGT